MAIAEMTVDVKVKFEDFSPLITGRVLDEVFEERRSQEKKWGQQNHPGSEYLMILGEEVGEANKEYLEVFFAAKKSQVSGHGLVVDYSSYRKELIQIAAVAVAMVESLDRNGR